jgi:hypothetical protein
MQPILGFTMNTKTPEAPATVSEAAFSITRDCRRQLAETHMELFAALTKTWRANTSLLKSALAYPAGVSVPLWESARSLLDLQTEYYLRAMETATGTIEAGQHYGVGVLAYLNEFMNPYWTALVSFSSLEKDKLVRERPFCRAPWIILNCSGSTSRFAEQGAKGTMSGLDDFHPPGRLSVLAGRFSTCHLANGRKGSGTTAPAWLG